MFLRPVDSLFPIKRHYGEKGYGFDWSIDPDLGLWVPMRQGDGQGQHRGTDFDCPRGTPIRAMSDGITLRARHESALDAGQGAGLYLLQLVVVLGYDSWVIKYSHLKAVYVKVGVRVQRGDFIAESGSSGAVESPYLHVDLMNLKRQWQAIPLPCESLP